MAVMSKEAMDVRALLGRINGKCQQCRLAAGYPIPQLSAGIEECGEVECFLWLVRLRANRTSAEERDGQDATGPLLPSGRSDGFSS